MLEKDERKTKMTGKKKRKIPQVRVAPEKQNEWKKIIKIWK